MRIDDRLSICELINAWIYRDVGDWERLRTLFHPEGTIEVIWFEGRFSDFVDASMRMGTTAFRTKHLMGAPVITFNGDKAMIETNVVIVADNAALDLGCTAHNRFIDLAEKRDGVWKLVSRKSVYDMGAFTFPTGMSQVDRSISARYPREYAVLGYMLEQAGYTIARLFATRGSALERAIREEGRAWLDA